MKCIKCGTENQDGILQCVACGNLLSDGIIPQTQMVSGVTQITPVSVVSNAEQPIVQTTVMPQVVTESIPTVVSTNLTTNSEQIIQPVSQTPIVSPVTPVQPVVTSQVLSDVNASTVQVSGTPTMQPGVGNINNITVNNIGSVKPVSNPNEANKLGEADVKSKKLKIILIVLIVVLVVVVGVAVWVFIAGQNKLKEQEERLKDRIEIVWTPSGSMTE